VVLATNGSWWNWRSFAGPGEARGSVARRRRPDPRSYRSICSRAARRRAPKGARRVVAPGCRRADTPGERPPARGDFAGRASPHVERENDDAFTPGARLASESAEQFGKERLVDAVREVPHGLPARRRHERGEIKPFVAMMAERDRPLANRRPNAPMDRLQAEAMLILRPYFDRLVGMLLGFFGERVSKLFLKAASCSGVAELGCRGRGDWIDQPIAWSASQPRCGASLSSPNWAAIQAATFPLVHRPPSGGGSRSRSLSLFSSSGGEHGRSCAVVAAQISQCTRPQRVVAGLKLLNPARHKAR